MRINLGPASEILLNVPLSFPFVYGYTEHFLHLHRSQRAKVYTSQGCRTKHVMLGKIFLNIYFTLFMAAAHLHTIANIKKCILISSALPL